MRNTAQAAIDLFLSAEMQRHAAGWLYHAAVILVTLISVSEAPNIFAFICAFILALARAGWYAGLQVVTLPRHAYGVAHRHCRGLTVLLIVYLASHVIGGADAAATSDKLQNVTRAVQSCNIESFSGEAACCMSDYCKRIGLPVTLPQTLAEDDSIELTTALGLFDDKTYTYYNGTKLRIELRGSTSSTPAPATRAYIRCAPTLTLCPTRR